jgi:hypothetical protein
MESKAIEIVKNVENDTTKAEAADDRFLNESGPAGQQRVRDSLLPRWYPVEPQISRLDEAPKSLSLSDVQEYLSTRFEEMKESFTSEGANASSDPRYFFFCEDGNYSLLNIYPDTLEFRAMLRKFVRDFARKHDAYAVAAMADTWEGSKSCREGMAPCDDPLRREALQVHIRMREGNACRSRKCLYERRDGKILWQETSNGWIEGGKLYAIPVWWMHAKTFHLNEGPKSSSLTDVREYMTKLFDDLKAVFDDNTRPGFFFFSEGGNYVMDLIADFSLEIRPGTRVFQPAVRVT